MATNMINDIESNDIKASYTVSRVLWTMLDTVFAGDDEEDALSFSDKELLDDILRFGTIAEVARRKGEPYQSVRLKVVHSLERLEKKIKWIETKEHQLRHELANAKTLIDLKDKKLKDQELRLIEKDADIHQLQTQLSQVQGKQEQWDEKEKKWNEQFVFLNKQLLVSAQTITDLRHANGKIQAILDSCKAEEEMAQQLAKTNTQLKQALAKLNKASEKEKTLLRKISSLENLVEYYKKERFSSNNDTLVSG